VKTLDELLEIDASCAKGSELVFRDLPESLASANAGLAVFEAAGRWMAEYESDNPAQKRFDEAAKELGISRPELVAAIRKPADPSEHAAITKARGADRDIGQSTCYRTLLQLAYRAYRSGLTDLRRLKLTAAAGHLRLEAESAALMVLFVDQPAFAERWLNPTEDMLKFFRESQPHVKKYLAEHELKVAYEHGSAVSQHAGFLAAIVGGLGSLQHRADSFDLIAIEEAAPRVALLQHREVRAIDQSTRLHGEVERPPQRRQLPIDFCRLSPPAS
jgi:hypothetical protein